MVEWITAQYGNARCTCVDNIDSTCDCCSAVSGGILHIIGEGIGSDNARIDRTGDADAGGDVAIDIIAGGRAGIGKYGIDFVINRVRTRQGDDRDCGITNDDGTCHGCGGITGGIRDIVGYGISARNRCVDTIHGGNISGDIAINGITRGRSGIGVDRTLFVINGAAASQGDDRCSKVGHVYRTDLLGCGIAL